MAKEDGFDGELITEQAAASTSLSQEVDSQEPAEKDDNQQDLKKRKDKEESTNKLPYYKLYSFANFTDFVLIGVGTIGAIGNGMCMPLMTLIFGNLVNAYGENEDTKKVVDEVSKVSLNFVFLAIAAGALGFLQMTCWIVTGERQAARIRSLYLKTMLRQDVGFFDTESYGEIVERMSGEILLIQDAMGEKVGKLIELGSTYISGFVIAFIKGWLLTFVLLSSVPPLFITGAVMNTVMAKMASRGQAAYSVSATVSQQTIGAIRTVASFTGEKQAVAKYNESLTKAYKSGVQEGLAFGLGFGSISFVSYTTYALAVWFGGKMILEKGYSGGDVITVLFAIMAGAYSTGQASRCISAFGPGQAAAYKLFEAIKRKPQIDAYDTNGVKLDDIRGDIELKDVDFSYPARPDEQVFSEFSLTIPGGITAALVGQSGSGKSTVISLIERFYDPQAGEVLIDGINLKEFQLKWIREKVGLVSQEPVLFSSSIKDNIAYAKDSATIQEIRAAAELANAAIFIDNLPQGLDTLVGEHGTQLSGGQKQRIAIARAILKNPRILLLDEATSALDAESERIVQDALERVMINRTTVIVAHRLSTIRNADMIAVIHQGKIVEKGTHSELTNDPDGAYNQLIRLQETSVVSEENVAKDQDGPEIVVNSGRNSIQRMSLTRSISRGSSGNGNSSRHSFSVSFHIPTGIDVQELAPIEVEPLTSASESSKPPPEVSLSRLAYFSKPEIPSLLLGTIAAVLTGLQLPVFGILLSGVIKSFFEPEDELRKHTKFWSLLFFLLAISCLIVFPLQSYSFAVAGSKLIRRIRSMSFEKVVNMEISWFDEPDHSSGAIGARLSADAASFRRVVGDALGLLVQNIATIIAGLVIAFEANWEMALIVSVLLPLIGVNGYIQMKYTKGFSAEAKKMYEEASQVANDAIGSIRTVASFCAEEKVMEIYEKKCEGPVKASIKQGLAGGVAFGLSFCLLFLFYAGSFYFGVLLFEAGRATFSEIFRVFYALFLAANGVSQSGFLAPDASKAVVAVASIFAILDRKSKIDSSDESGTTIESVKGDIEFRHVSFTYPSRPDIKILKDLSLAIRYGKTVALVGESGSGKSTVISLLQRFYDPDTGHITLDGIEIQKLQLKWFRQQVGLVSQEPVLFNDTIRANIAYSKEGNATEAEILTAAKLANAHNFISSLKQGYDTVAGERGVQLSGGQKQRIAIARAIVKDPKILLLDEATSALDAESERVVQDALDRVMVGRTTLMIAHRLSTIKGVDLIAVVKNGMIAEKGKHETLMNIKDGIYASLVTLHTGTSS
ncbi:ABC transporter B family member 11-like [Pistacia vera]|uniref:ABC transporter B family member 11-like n=1 Tax=Pistacia vera TaxID=55513 RepID=UPI001263A678|nr:ABC transporter B family member 11-like [Pistacia vera]